MRNGNRTQSAKPIDQGDGGGIDQRDAIPLDVPYRRTQSSARCPMANFDCVPTPVRPGSYWKTPLRCKIPSRSSVVHAPPGTSLGGYCVPQAEQMNAGMVFPFLT